MRGGARLWKPEADCCVSLMGLRVTGGGWVQPLADNTILHLSELEGFDFWGIKSQVHSSNAGSFASNI